MRPVYTDGSFSITAPLLDVLYLTCAELTTRFARATKGIYVPVSSGAPPVALFIRTPPGSATDAYYQELLGISVAMLMSTYTPLYAYSDCSSAISRATQALFLLGTAIGHLQHGSLHCCLGFFASLTNAPPTQASHGQSRTRNGAVLRAPGLQTTGASTWRMLLLAILTAAFLASTPTFVTQIKYMRLLPLQARGDHSPFYGSLQKRAQRHQFLQYRKQRDIKRIYANAPSRWTRYCPSPMALLTKVRDDPRPVKREDVQRRTKHHFDWMAHAVNLAKESPKSLKRNHSLCTSCGQPETQSHVNVSCSHPPLVEARRVDEFFMTYRHTAIPPAQRWIAPLMNHMENHMWDDTEEGGDIWNGRWTRSKLDNLIPDASSYLLSQKMFTPAIRRLTEILQWVQSTLYHIRHIEHMSKEAKERCLSVIALRRKFNLEFYSLVDQWF